MCFYFNHSSFRKERDQIESNQIFISWVQLNRILCPLTPDLFCRSQPLFLLLQTVFSKLPCLIYHSYFLFFFCFSSSSSSSTTVHGLHYNPPQFLPLSGHSMPVSLSHYLQNLINLIIYFLWSSSFHYVLNFCSHCFLHSCVFWVTL